jgi:hypothetical protein
MLQASKIAGEVYAVWAAQGPFENGESSAKAMRYANLVVRGKDSLDDKKSKESIFLHEKAYNAEPERWEALRQKSLPLATGEKFQKQLAMVKQMSSNTFALRTFGDNLLNNGSKESKDLVALLNEIYKSR